MLDNVLIDYILNYFSRFMTLQEKAANKHYSTSFKFSKSISNDTNGEKTGFLQERGWLSNDNDVLNLFKDGYKQFRLNTAERIFTEHHDKIYFNNCAKCGRLARTPQAKQCRFCGYSWHKQVVASFQIASAFHVTGRGFFVLGDILTGEIKMGMKIDLTMIGLAKKPTIMGIEFARHNDDGIVWENIGLGLSELSEDDKEFLKSKSPFRVPVLIEDPASC
jgi:hypothetical protein